MRRLRALIGSLRLRLALLLLASMSGGALLGGFVALQALAGAERAPARSPAAIWHHVPDYAILLVLVSVVLTVAAVRRVTQPLAILAKAAESFAASLDPRPLAYRVPTEFRPVLRAFNLMQQRVSEGVQERLHMLSAINHDLRTPMARLSLRLDHVEEVELRARLQADVVLLKAMVARGMELARGGGVEEPWAEIDLAALLHTIADDAVASGNDVRCEPGCAGTVGARPETLVRCLTNLVDNAVRYGGAARLTCEVRPGETHILVLDRGPGIPDEQLEAAFRPFTRLGNPGRLIDGSGLGLTIARQQARSLGGEITISNRPEGGLAAIVSLPRCPIRA